MKNELINDKSIIFRVILLAVPACHFHGFEIRSVYVAASKKVQGLPCTNMPQ